MHEPTGRSVAIKVLHDHLREDPDQLERFLREAELVSSLDHPHIVAVAAWSAEPGQPSFLVMDFVTGGSLAELMRLEAPLTPMRAAGLAVQVLDALEAAHSRGVVHRDLKPANILLSKSSDMSSGSADWVILVDFGIAKLLDGVPRARLTALGSVLGTPAYMAPEQAKAGSVDGRADLYSLGVILFGCLTGRLPYEASRPDRILQELVQGHRPSVGDVRADLDSELAGIVDRALAVDVAERFGSAREMRHALEHWMRPIARELSALESAALESAASVEAVPVETVPVETVPVETVPVETLPAGTPTSWEKRDRRVGSTPAPPVDPTPTSAGEGSTGPVGGSALPPRARSLPPRHAPARRAASSARRGTVLSRGAPMFACVGVVAAMAGVSVLLTHTYEAGSESPETPPVIPLESPSVSSGEVHPVLLGSVARHGASAVPPFAHEPPLASGMVQDIDGPRTGRGVALRALRTGVTTDGARAGATSYAEPSVADTKAWNRLLEVVPDLHRCVATELMPPHVIEWELAVEQDGAVTAATATGSSWPGPARACALECFRAIRFEPSGAPRVVVALFAVR